MENTQEITKVKKEPVQNLSIANASDTLSLATDVAKYIKELKLYQNIQGKEFVNVEGWQYAGSRLGIVPVMEQVINVSTDTEIKYQAKVILLNLSTGQTVGAGFAVCSNKEQGKKFYQEFAIASMAQTRAIGKAYRNILAWIIRAAGYEPTPAEEMDYEGNVPKVKSEQPKAEYRITGLPAQPAPEQVHPSDAAAVANDAPIEAIKYASPKQKEEIIRLLNNQVITRPEKTKALLNINKLDEDRADKAISYYKKLIQDRESEVSVGGGAALPGE